MTPTEEKVQGVFAGIAGGSFCGLAATSAFSIAEYVEFGSCICLYGVAASLVGIAVGLVGMWAVDRYSWWMWYHRP